MDGSVENCLANADTDRSLRLFFSASSTSSADIENIKVNMGNYSGQNVDTITFYPAEQTPTEPYEIKDGVLTINGEAGMDAWDAVASDYYLDKTIKTLVINSDDVIAIPADIFNGLADQGTTYLQPKATATRAQIAAIIMRYLSSK